MGRDAKKRFLQEQVECIRNDIQQLCQIPSLILQVPPFAQNLVDNDRNAQDFRQN